MFARARFVSGPDGATVIDVALYFGHPEVDLALVDVFSPVQPELFSAHAQVAPVNPGFAGRRELWRLHEYLGVIAVDGGGDFGRAFLSRLAAAVRQYA
jgi:fructosamine-3-kinase